MKKKMIAIFAMALLCAVSTHAQNTGGKLQQTIQKGQQTVNKVKTMVAVFQPYLLKAKELFGQGKQLVKEARSAARSPNGNTAYNSADPNTAGSTATNYPTANNYPATTTDPYPATNNTPSAATPSYNPASGTAGNTATGTPSPYGVYDNYTPEQYLPVNNEATINQDGSGNWGQQNNALYGNCLDVFTGTVMGVGEAEESPASVDVIFIAANGAYALATPNWVRNEVAAQYTSRPVYEAVSKWKEVNETEIAETKISIAQFDKINNNSQILNVVKNTANYASMLTLFGNLGGKVFAVKAELENRTVYGLIAIDKQIGTTGSNGYLRIRVKSQGIDNNGDGFADPSAYIR